MATIKYRQIKKLRLSKGLTQEDLAIKAKLERSYISKVERNKLKPSLEKLKRIAKALGIDYKDLLI